jgi:hypothetical protein
VTANSQGRRSAGPDVIRELDTPALVLMEGEARDQNFSQRLQVEWVRRHVAEGGTHIAQVALEVAAQKLPPRSPHWRLLVLLSMRDGRLALSLLDCVPESFLENSRAVPDDTKQDVKDALSGAMSLADWERSLLDY